jgi:hypothetical protein
MTTLNADAVDKNIGTVTIRLATIDDVPVCMQMMVELRNENFWRHIYPHTDLAIATIFVMNRLLTNTQSCLYVAELDGAIIGICGGEIVTNFLMPHITLVNEWAWWVIPEHRNGTVGARLWFSVCDWAKKHGVRYSIRTKSINSERRGNVIGSESYTVRELGE